MRLTFSRYTLQQWCSLIVPLDVGIWGFCCSKIQVVADRFANSELDMSLCDYNMLSFDRFAPKLISDYLFKDDYSKCTTKVFHVLALIQTCLFPYSMPDMFVSVFNESRRTWRMLGAAWKLDRQKVSMFGDRDGQQNGWVGLQHHRLWLWIALVQATLVIVMSTSKAMGCDLSKPHMLTPAMHWTLVGTCFSWFSTWSEMESLLRFNLLVTSDISMTDVVMHSPTLNKRVSWGRIFGIGDVLLCEGWGSDCGPKKLHFSICFNNL